MKDNVEIIENLRVPSLGIIKLEGKTFIVRNNIEIAPGGKLIIKNATLKFEKEAGIIGKDCIFIAKNSCFEPTNEKEGWKNITIGGKIKGYIKSCTFKDGKGRKGEEINQLLGLDLWKDETHGGGLFVHFTEGDYLISDSTFENCSAYWGGGVFALSSTLENCTFKKCHALNGGGVYASGSIIESSEFEECSAPTNFFCCSGSGGGVYASNSKIKNCTFKNCEAFYEGGGTYTEDSIIENCTFQKCSSEKGGGVYSSKNVELFNCCFENCNGNGGGGACVENSKIENSIFKNCSAFDSGGGVEGYENVEIKECKFENCKADFGGGVWAWENVQIENCLFENCQAEYGGGVGAEKYLTLKECQFGNCSASEGGGVYCEDSSNILKGNTFKNCKPDNCGGKCFC